MDKKDAIEQVDYFAKKSYLCSLKQSHNTD